MRKMSRGTIEADKKDTVAEVLKDIVAGKTISKERAHAALAYHNKVCESIKDTKEGEEAKVYWSIERNRLDLKQKQEEIEKLRLQLKEERSRLSKVAGDKLSADNPDLADLSDPHRPTRLVECFKQLYDDEWTHAFEDLERTRMSERNVIEMLAKILKTAETFCEEAANQQMQNMIFQNQLVVDELTRPKFRKEKYPDPVMSSTKYELNNHEEEIVRVHVKQLRKALARTSVRGLTQIFANCYLSKLIDSSIKPCDGINSFVRRAIELVWMMKIQDTPMELTWAKSHDTFDRNQFSQYTRKGQYVDYAVWPGVLLHAKGPLMSKGIVQCKNI